MYPTMFEIPYLPEWLADVKSYGVMMMIAFLTGIWWACRRAEKSQADPDVVLNLGFIALVFGVLGARIFFVLHYWDTRFANQPSPLWAVLDIRAGGLEFWGGPMLAIPAQWVYLRYFAKASARWYLDIAAPSLMWGLAITRIGCFLNGCCWGAICTEHEKPEAPQVVAAVPWAVQFPYGSPAMIQQYQFGQLTLPKELIYSPIAISSTPFPKEFIDDAVKDGGATWKRLVEKQASADQHLSQLRQAGAAEDELKAAKQEVEQVGKASLEFLKNTTVGIVQKRCLDYGLTVEQLADLASHYPSRPVHPAQLYGCINGILLALLLNTIFYYRKRHGVVIAIFLILYSIARILLESIRQDNPLDIGGLTISQAVSLSLGSFGVLLLFYLYRLPLRSPLAVPFVYEDDEPPATPKNARPAT